MGMYVCVSLCSVDWVAKETGWGIERPFTLAIDQTLSYCTASLHYQQSNVNLLLVEYSKPNNKF